MDLALELVEGDLAHDRVDHVLDLLGEHRLALAPVVRLLQQRAEGQHFAEHACRLGQRQRRRGHQRALCARQHLMDAMAEFVRERHDVARLAHVVEQHIGVRRRYSRMCEGARRLARPNRRVDPSAVEEGAAQCRPFPARSGDRPQARCSSRPPIRSSPSASPATARCGPSGSSGPCPATSPSWRSSDATGADRLRERRRPAHRPPRARRDWRGAGNRRCP